MSELPTRNETLEHLSRGWKCHDNELGEGIDLLYGVVLGPIGYAYANGDLLTRKEAAADPEVQRTVFDNWQVRQAWEVTDDE